MLVGDSHSIKKAKEVINELLNLDPPASNATSASAQSKNAPKLKPKPKPQLVKKLPPMPTEPKPVGQVSRFSLLIPGDSKDDEISEDSTHGDSDLETNQKDDWLPRETKTNSKKKKKERKKSEKSSMTSSDTTGKKSSLDTEKTTKSIKTEKNPVCQKETIKPTPKPTQNPTQKPTQKQQKPTPIPSDSTSSQSKKSNSVKKSIPPKINPPTHSCLSAEEDVKTPTSTSLDQDFLKTSQNLDLEEFRKSLEQINNGFNDGILGRNGSISSLGQSDDSICDKTTSSTLDGVTDLSLYSIQGTISNLQGKLIQGLKGIESKENCFIIVVIRCNLYRKSSTV